MLKKEIKKLSIDLYGIGGIENHIHILVKCAPNHVIPVIVKNIKGSSSHFVNNELQPDFYFQWQRGYGIFTVSKWNVAKIKNYLHNQRKHHTENTIIPELEKFDSEDD